ncbi:MAG: YbjN domain-containing protein [Paracoccaceae bacterium]|nr:YbjN domain-containing protein [Paracoccaceae bacterium]
MRRISLAFAGALALGTPTVAETAKPIVVMTHPGAVALAMRDRGYRARLTKDSADRPMIESGVGGFLFDIVFYHCDGSDECSGVLFHTGFDLEQGIGLNEINYWNSDRLVGRAFVDEECDPFLDHYVTADPLMSLDAFDELFGDWEVALDDFADYIGFTDNGPRDAVAQCGPGTDAI